MAEKDFEDFKGDECGGACAHFLDSGNGGGDVCGDADGVFEINSCYFDSDSDNVFVTEWIG